MYLLINVCVDTKTRAWLNKHAVQVTKNAWVNTATVEGTTFLAVNYRSLRHMQPQINSYVGPYLDKIHAWLMEDRVPKSSKHLICNKLKLIMKASHCMDAVQRAEDLFNIIAQEKIQGTDKPQSTVSPLIEDDSVQSYLLGLVKNETIH